MNGMRLPSLIAGAFFIGNAWAQFSGLAANDDGSVVYFVTDLRLQTETDLKLPGTSAIYRANASGVVERMTVPESFNLQFPISFGNVQLSGDGTVMSYTRVFGCNGGSSCVLTDATTSFSYVAIAGQPYGEPLGGSAQISRNSRYIWNYGSWSTFLSSTLYDELLDLRSGAKTQTPVRPSNKRQVVTSTGSVLGFDLKIGTSLVLWSSTNARTIATEKTPTTAIINDAGTQIVYESSTTTGIQLRAIDLTSGTDVLLASRDSSMQPTISNDGVTIAYVAEPEGSSVAQAWLIRPDGGGRRQLTNFPEGVSEAVLTGSGTTLLGVSGTRILRIESQSGTVQEVIGKTIQCRPGFLSLVPGEILPITGIALTDSVQTAATPLPTSLGGVQVLMDGTPLPMLTVSPNQIWFQVPYELTPGPTVSVSIAHSSLFEGCSPIRVSVKQRQPYMFSSLDILTLAHQDFQSLASHSSPVHPGEIVHAYAVGLGVVSPAMQTGIPAPSDRLFPLAQPINCLMGTALDGPPLNVLFAGLAPGTIGIDQIDIEMPSPLPAQDFLLTCGTPDIAAERHGGSVPVLKRP